MRSPRYPSPPQPNQPQTPRRPAAVSAAAVRATVVRYDLAADGLGAQPWLLGGGSRPPSPAERRRRWWMLLAGFGLQAGFVLLLGFGFFHVQPVGWAKRPLKIVMLYAPPLPVTLVPPVTAPPAVPRPRKRRLRLPARAAVPPQPKPQPVAAAPTPSPRSAPQLASARTEPNRPERPRRVAVMKPAVARIEMGRFGTPRGIRPDPAHAMPIPELGSFGTAAAAGSAAPDPPASPVAVAGFGSATAAGDDPAGGDAGVVAVAGFGSAAATASGVGRSLAEVRAPVFDAATPSPPAPAPRSTPVAAAPAFQPPQVLSWPKPVYTPAAARHRVQGEVLLEVRFGADGSVTVLQVKRGLGYGLDTAARSAAVRIQFRPAERNGQPVDWIGTVRIQFALAE